jgi:hypothetical protein
MTTFKLDIEPSRSAAGRFVFAVRKLLLEAYEKSGLSTEDLANLLRDTKESLEMQFRGEKDISLSRAAEIAYFCGEYRIEVNLVSDVRYEVRSIEVCWNTGKLLKDEFVIHFSNPSEALEYVKPIAYQSPMGQNMTGYAIKKVKKLADGTFQENWY